ncbi:MAG: hypothetical protein AB8B55_02115 [Mariniblastus sp.]
MPTSKNVPLAICVLVCLQMCSGAFSQAQELKKAIRDYKGDRVFNYQPNDPWYRGKLFNIHTKHYGMFYNCDGEEAKRNSPYLCWKAHHEKDFPTRYRALDIARYDLAIIQRRIRDGAGDCIQGCECQSCQSAPVASSCNCTECQGGQMQGGEQIGEIEYLSQRESTPGKSISGKSTPGQRDRTPRHEVFSASDSPTVSGQRSRKAANTSHPQQRQTARNQPSTKYGLVSGKIVNTMLENPPQPYANSTQQTASAKKLPWHRQPKEAATTRTADKGTLSSSDYFLNLKRR